MKTLTHNWSIHTTARGNVWHVHNGKMDQAVKDKPLAEGFLWQFKKVSSHSPTLAEAKEWIETLAEAGRSYKRVIGR